MKNLAVVMILGSLNVISAFAGDFECVSSARNAIPASFVLTLGRIPTVKTENEVLNSIHALSANEAEGLDGYERPNADQSTYEVQAWNSNDASAFLLVPKVKAESFTVQLTYDEEGGAPFNSSGDVTIYTCTASN